MPAPTQLRLKVSRSGDEVSALWQRPRSAQAVLVLAHGAGADMHHAFMSEVSERLAKRRIATLRFQFPYAEAKARRPDPPAKLLATVRSAIELARERARGLPLFAGGKSLGGRMTSTALADLAEEDVLGVVFFGFPLHPAGRPGLDRAEHLARTKPPLLFLQGTRDTLADLDRMRQVCASLGSRATLHVVEGADHGFHVLKRSGRSDAEVLDELADTARDWISREAGA